MDTIQRGGNFHRFEKEMYFRGVSNIDYELIPNALRKNNDDGKYVLCDYINSNISIDYHSTNFKDIEYNDNEKLTLELQYKREFFVLFRFLDLADKSGLKIPASRKVRKLLHPILIISQSIGLNQNFMKPYLQHNIMDYLHVL
ncbi:hypothetical protein [uncultured Methanobrevibacter sp.]|uniref:hypothetical protein n=1 Tax=uncultured Methanobrevibacter sp. TaxID=253161 RepID=UPI0025FF344C|nr:hypothetical protein [uncultured Methanobrevibacter sp.]